MAKNNNLTDFLTDVANAIRKKKRTTDLINPQDFSSEIESIETGGGDSGTSWTGHADIDGLRAIGWTDEDIAYYQATGVNWNAEDDEYHKVTDDNKALYGVLTADNIQTYKERIVYLPKIDTSSVTSMTNMFYQCGALVAIPLLDTSSVTMMNYMFGNCYSLVSIPQLNTSSVKNMNNMFSYCYSLKSIPLLDTSNVTNMNNMFSYCYSLKSIPLLDTSSVTNMSMMFYQCGALVAIPLLDTSSVTSVSNMFYNCGSLTHINIKNVKHSCNLSNSALLSKESLLYLIDNKAGTSMITITLAPYAYERLAEDADVVAALDNNPNMSIAQ